MKDAEEFLAQLNIEPSSTEVSAVKTAESDLERLIESRAVALLATREHGLRELRRKLIKKFPETPEVLEQNQLKAGEVARLIDTVLDKCRQNNWQSEQRYIEQAVQSYVNKGHGPLKIRQKLQLNCADSQQIDAALDLGEELWWDLARQALNKKYGDCLKPGSRNEQAKRMRFLQGRGFSQGTIWKAFD